MDHSVLLYWLVILALSYGLSAFTSVIKASVQWANLVIREEDRQSGRKSYHFPAEFFRQLKNVAVNLIPRSCALYNNWLYILGTIFILSGFSWVPWFHPIVALPIFLKVSPLIFRPLIPGRSRGHKELILKGIEQVISKLIQVGADPEHLRSAKELIGLLESLEWQPGNVEFSLPKPPPETIRTNAENHSPKPDLKAQNEARIKAMQEKLAQWERAGES
jgi:hypothetical protein